MTRTIKRTLVLALALLLPFLALGPMALAADSDEDTNYVHVSVEFAGANTWYNLEKAINSAQGPTYISIYDPVVWNDGGKPLNIGADKDLIIDFHGHSMQPRSTLYGQSYHDSMFHINKGAKLKLKNGRICSVVFRTYDKASAIWNETDGAGVYVSKKTAIRMSGNHVVTDNWQQNVDHYGAIDVRLVGDKLIQVDGEMTEGANVFVGPDKDRCIVTSGYSAHNSAHPNAFFHSYLGENSGIIQKTARRRWRTSSP